MILTAKHIDRACRDGLFVWTSNRQRILGCQTELREQGKADTGKVWVHMESDLQWLQIPITQIVIENPKGESEMPQKGKGRAGAATHIGSRKSSKKAAAKAGGGTMDLIDIDSRKIKAIEDAEEARQSASEQISVANKAYEEAEKAVISAMHSNGFDPIKRPVYTRAPWGSVTLQQTGEVKEKVKFTAIKKGKKNRRSKRLSLTN